MNNFIIDNYNCKFFLMIIVIANRVCSNIIELYIFINVKSQKKVQYIVSRGVISVLAQDCQRSGSARMLSDVMRKRSHEGGGRRKRRRERKRERERRALRAFRHGDEVRAGRARGQWLRCPQVQGNRAGPIRHVVSRVPGETEQVTRLPL